MADLDQIITEVVVISRTEGVEETRAATGRLGASIENLANSNDELAASDAKVATVSERSTRFKISAAAAAERLQRQLDQEYRSQKLMAEAMRDLERARQQGIISASREAELIALAQTRYTSTAAAMKVSTVANENFHKSAGITANQLQNISYQLQDAAVQLQGGQSPFTVLLQQGSQLQPILSETGIGGAIRGVGSAIGRFITPAIGTVALLTGAVIYGYSAWSRYDDEQKGVGTTLAGLGRNVGLTKDQFEGLAASAAKAGNVSTRTALDLGKTYAATGQIGPGNIAALIAVSKDAAATFGVTLDEVKEKLASAFGNAAGIDGLNKQLNFLDARTQRTIQSLFDQGRAQDAIRLAIEKLPAALAKAEDGQGLIARGWEKIKTAISDADLALGRFLDKGTKTPQGDDKLKLLQDRLVAARAALRDAETQSTRTFRAPQAALENLKAPGGEGAARLSAPVADFRYPDTQDLQQKKAVVKDFEAQLLSYGRQLDANRATEQKAAEQKALEESLNKKSNELRGLVKEVGAGSDEWLKYRDLQTAVDDALKSGNPELMRRVDSVRDLKEAQDVLRHVTESTTNAEGQRMTQAEKAARQREIDIAGARAVTTGDKARVAQMQAEERQRGQMVTAAQAQADAEHAVQMVREQESAALRGMLRDQGLEADEIRKRIALLDVDAESRAVAVARQKAEQDLTRQGIALNGELAQSVIRGAEANARLGVSFDKAVEAQRRMQDAQREVSSEFATFADDVLLGSRKMSEAFASLSKTFASGSLKALLTGEGPLAGLFGTQAAERGQVGGLLGGQFSLNKLFDTAGIKDAIGEGAYTGISDAFAPMLKQQRDASGKNLGFMSTPLGQGLGVAAAGGALGYSSQSPITGALGGAAAGLMTGNLALAAAGPAIGFGAVFGKRRPAAEAPKPDTQEKPADDRDQRPLAA